MNKPRHKTFAAWFNANLRDSASDIANHGADCGYPYITYNSDCAIIFDAYADEIWTMAVETADDMGAGNVCQMIGGFKRSDMLEDFTTFKTLMVWFACEELSRSIEDRKAA
jgi:hypothetical protein